MKRSADLTHELATALRDLVAPRLGAVAGRAHTRSGAGGDVTFAIDAEAERFLGEWITAHAPSVAFYSEDRGLVAPAGGEAATEYVLVVDPIDGTRPALAGLEAACTSVALAPLSGERQPTMADVVAGAVVEIKSGDWFLAERGGGARASVPIAVNDNEDVERAFWTYGFRGRPARAAATVIGELIDASSVGGGTFELGSATFDMTRVVSGQTDAYLEPGPRLVAEVEGMRAEFERVGRGHVLNNSPYDVAAAALICSEAGAVITDAAGRPLDDRPLLGSGVEFQMSILVACTSGLHAAFLAGVDRGLARLREELVSARQLEG